MTRALFLFALLALLLPRPAQAYIDPGTGSYLVQALVAGAMGGLMVVRTQWHRIKGFFRGGPSTEEPSDAAGPPGHSDGK